ncbi:DsbA family protein [Nocardia zapadnayensis]|uniref:DsbA family protein n=1 Tax=Nocardia rhamnosiphila TaxID=426716 RepID=UPI002246A83C|nr:thioredoxin domain-containing protein [Nocardia zapadnayensis]MCX0270750.1 DsbA family protein [Nocardia zapadnayensis]
MSKNPGRPNPLAAGARADRNRKIAMQVGVAVVLVALVAAIGIGLAVRNSGSDDVGPIPAVATDNGAIRVGQPDAHATVRIVADMQCPVCKRFEADHAELLSKSVTDGTAAIEYNIVGYLDEMSSTEYSTRAANASYCVADTGTGKYQDWLKLMFQQQPPEQGAGLTDEQLIAIAQQAGYTDPTIAGCITDRKYDGFVAAKSQESLNEGIDATPTVFVNGEKVDLALKQDGSGFDTAPLTAAIQAATGR